VRCGAVRCGAARRGAVGDGEGSVHKAPHKGGRTRTPCRAQEGSAGPQPRPIQLLRVQNGKGPFPFSNYAIGKARVFGAVPRAPFENRPFQADEVSMLAGRRHGREGQRKWPHSPLGSTLTRSLLSKDFPIRHSSVGQQRPRCRRPLTTRGVQAALQTKAPRPSPVCFVRLPSPLAPPRQPLVWLSCSPRIGCATSAPSTAASPHTLLR